MDEFDEIDPELGISHAMRRRLVEFSDELDREGVALVTRIAVFGSLIALSLAELPGDQARIALGAHIDACRQSLADPDVIAAGDLLRARRRQ